MKEAEKKSNIIGIGFIFKYYIHRIWRITPPYMIIVMISSTLTKYFGNGPFFSPNGFEIDQCRETWWTNLLYINNLVKTEKLVINFDFRYLNFLNLKCYFFFSV